MVEGQATNRDLKGQEEMRLISALTRLTGDSASAGTSMGCSQFLDIQYLSTRL